MMIRWTCGEDSIWGRYCMGSGSKGPWGPRRNGEWILLDLGEPDIRSSWRYLALSVWYEGPNYMTVCLVWWNRSRCREPLGDMLGLRRQGS